MSGSQDERVTGGGLALVRLWPVVAIPALGYALWAFVFNGPAPRVLFGIFKIPPLYGYWAPIDVELFPLLLAFGLMVGGIILYLKALSKWTHVTGAALVILAIFLAFGVGMVRGDINVLTRNVKTQSYATDVHFVDDYGVREFARAHPELVDRYASYPSKTKPPGALIFLWTLYEVVGDHAMRVAVIIAGIGLFASFVAFAVGNTIADLLAGKLGFVLFLTAPGPLLLAFSSMDIIFALLLSAAGAAFMYSLSRDDWRWSVVAGGVLGVATLFTFASVFITVATAVTAILLLRDVRRFLLHMAAAGLSGVFVLLTARLTIGIDVLASYGAYRDISSSGFPWEIYWVFGQPIAILIYMGLPIAVFAFYAMSRREILNRGAMYILVLSVFALVWFALPDGVTAIRRGEMERIWSHLYPLYAGLAGAGLARWVKRARVSPTIVVVVLAVVTLVQAVYIESRLDTIF